MVDPELGHPFPGNGPEGKADEDRRETRDKRPLAVLAAGKATDRSGAAASG
jgi:hypothetical protein